MFKAYALILWRAVQFSVRNRAPLADSVELTALAMLALVRFSSPTGKMYLGQVKAKARRIHIAHTATVALAARRALTAA